MIHTIPNLRSEIFDQLANLSEIESYISYDLKQASDDEFKEFCQNHLDSCNSVYSFLEKILKTIPH